jgi:hypothetical protein
MTDLISILMSMRGGEVALDCNRKFQELRESVLETGMKGKLNLAIEIKPSKLALGGAVIEVEMRHTCQIAKPELSVGRSLFFVAKDGSLTRDDPGQLALYDELREEVKHGE